MSEVNLETVCPKCGENLTVTADVPEVGLMSPTDFPEVRSKLEPTNVWLYKITSEDIRTFITQKAKSYVPGVKVEVVPRYCERKQRKHEKHRSYASLRIALSQEVIEKNDRNGWFGSIGIDNNSVTVTKTVLTNLIRKYSYDPKMINNWLSSYKTLEELEESFGMTEAYINDLKEYATPRRVQTNNQESWVIFAAAPENVIADMLTEVSTNKIPGTIKIDDVVPISKDIIEYTVYLYPQMTATKENPNVRKILLGEEKKKR